MKEYPLQTKQYPLGDSSVTVMQELFGNTTWFCANDLADAFDTTIDEILKSSGCKDDEISVQYHDDESNPKIIKDLWHGNDTEDKVFIYEAGFNNLLLFSKFNKTKIGRGMSNWFFGDVLPSIIKTRRYDLHKEDK